MAKEYYYIKKNNVDTRYQLKHAGYNVCHCCKSEDARWLAVYPKDWQPDGLAMSVHGIGYGCEQDCEGKCPSKCIMCGINETQATIHIFNDAESYLNYEKVQSKGDTQC